MYEGRTRSLFFKYALPQMVGLLFSSVYVIVDGVFIGNRLGRDALAAAAVAVPFMEILIALSMATASGAGVIISSRLAQNERESAVKSFNTAVLCCAVMGLFISAAGNAFLAPLARLLGATEQIHALAVSYLFYIVTFAPFMLFSFLLGGMVRNDGRPRLAMAALALGSVSNIILDYVFMYPLDMGIAGAALATALGPIFSVMILLPHFLLKRGALHFVRIKVRLAEIRRIFTLGFPSFIMEFTIGIVTFVYNFAIVRYGYGEIGLAAYLVIGYLMLIILTAFLGMAEGLQPVFSYLAGAGEKRRVEALRRFAVRIFLGVGIISYALIFFFSRGFFSIFSPGDAELIAFAHGRSLLYFSGFFLAGYNILMISFWQSTQATRRSLIVSLSRSIVFPAAFITVLPLIFGAEAMWICHSAAEAVTALIALALLFNRGAARTSCT